MKAHEFITRLDEARYGRRLSEDTKPVAEPPSHAPTSTAQWKTKSTGKSEDEGERMGGEKDAIKQSKHEIPAPVAKAPSHAPTSGKDYTTSGKGSSEDQGEKVSKEAIKETVNALLNGDEEVDVEALLGEGAHKPGCTCGFCQNKGKMGKKKEDEGEAEEKDGMNEDGYAGGTTRMAPPPVKRRLGGARMGFRSQVPKPKAAINPYQPAMEQKLATAKNAQRAIREMADELLDFPETE